MANSAQDAKGLLILRGVILGGWIFGLIGFLIGVRIGALLSNG